MVCPRRDCRFNFCYDCLRAVHTHGVCTASVDVDALMRAAALQGGGGVDAARTAIDGLVSYEPEEELKVGARIWSIYRESI